jgi:HK97 family phage portal protein
MAYLQEFLQTQRQQIAIQNQNAGEIGLPPGAAYSSYFPTWEVTAPQYPTPSPYSLMNIGYRTNEVAYACIELRSKAVSEPRARVWDKKKEEFLDDHPLYEFMEEPCPGVSETDFWFAVEMYLCITGFMPWEFDTSNDGSLINVWPMMPQYCSFKRGQQQLMRAIQYQPYTGLPAYDIDRSRFVLFSYTDPMYFGLKALSPTGVLADIIGLDNKITRMVEQFTRNGAFLGGLLKTEQIINETDARFARDRWQEAHGGAENAGQIAVIGKGMGFQTTNNTFREMVFPEVDARSETRICMGYAVPPILVSAKSGMDRATYSNYEQARKAWYEEFVTSEWRFLSRAATRDILPWFDKDPNHEIRFDTKEVKALQEDRTNQWKRAWEAYKSRVVIRDEARKEMGLGPMDDEEMGKEFYATAMEQRSLALEDNLDVPNAAESQEPVEELEVAGADRLKVVEEKAEEEKNFRAFAKRRIKEGKQADIPEFEFKHLDADRQRQLLSEYGVPDPDAEMVLKGLMEVLAATKANNAPPHINITANIEPGRAPDVHITQPEITVKVPKAEKAAAPVVNVEVSPTPVTVQNDVTVQPAEVNIPKVKRTTQRVKRDGGNNIEGTVTEYEHED